MPPLRYVPAGRKSPAHTRLHGEVKTSPYRMAGSGRSDRERRICREVQDPSDRCAASSPMRGAFATPQPLKGSLQVCRNVKSLPLQERCLPKADGGVGTFPVTLAPPLARPLRPLRGQLPYEGSLCDSAAPKGEPLSLSQREKPPLSGLRSRAPPAADTARRSRGSGRRMQAPRQGAQHDAPTATRGCLPQADGGVRSSPAFTVRGGDQRACIQFRTVLAY